MTIDEAAVALDDKLRPHNWYCACGAGSNKGAPALFIYCTKRSHPMMHPPKDFEGFPVVVRKTGRPRPALG